MFGRAFLMLPTFPNQLEFVLYLNCVLVFYNGFAALASEMIVLRLRSSVAIWLKFSAVQLVQAIFFLASFRPRRTNGQTSTRSLYRHRLVRPHVGFPNAARLRQL